MERHDMVTLEKELLGFELSATHLRDHFREWVLEKLHHITASPHWGCSERHAEYFKLYFGLAAEPMSYAAVARKFNVQPSGVRVQIRYAVHAFRHLAKKETLFKQVSRVRWASRHDLSPAQRNAIGDLHGGGVVVVKDPVMFKDITGLTDYIRENPDDFVYVVAGAVHYIHAALAGCRFGVMENHPQKRQDGSFGLAGVYHVGAGKIKRVWENPDPTSDKGEALIPVAH